MKKVLCVFIFLFCAITMNACSYDISKDIKNNISETCFCYFVGETQNYYVDLFCGEREDPYELDGQKNTIVAYTILSIEAKKYNKDKNALNYCIEINGKTYEGELTQNTLDDLYSVDLEINLSTDDTIYVYIQQPDITEVAKVSCVSNDFLVNNENIIDCLVNELSNELTSRLKDKQFECYIQVINKLHNEGEYYWSVSFVTDNGVIYNIIMDTVEGKILAKNL